MHHFFSEVPQRCIKNKYYCQKNNPDMIRHRPATIEVYIFLAEMVCEKRGSSTQPRRKQVIFLA